MLKRLALSLPAALLLAAIFSRPAAAYLDPGTGSYVLQTLLGIGFGVAYTVKLYWRQIGAYFRTAAARRRDRSPSEK